MMRRLGIHTQPNAERHAEFAQAGEQFLRHHALAVITDNDRARPINLLFNRRQQSPGRACVRWRFRLAINPHHLLLMRNHA